MYQNMPKTPTTSTQTAAINSSKITFNKNTNNKNSQFVKSSLANPKPPTAHIDIEHSSDPTNEIEEISKKISEHAEAIYRTWKSRGLAPTELLEFYANATNEGVAPTSTTTTPRTTTQIPNKTKKPIDADIVAATNDFLSTLASATNVNAATTEGLQQLVNSFVLKDKEQRAAGKNSTIDNIMTGKSNIQKTMTGGGASVKSTTTLKSAIIMKDVEKVPMTPIKNVVLKKITKTPTAPLTPIINTTTKITTTPTTTSSSSSPMLNINSAAAKTKQKIGNPTIQQQQQPTSLTTTAATTKVRSKKLENSELNNNIVGTTIKTKQKKTNISKTIDGPSVEINLNMDLNLNLHINDVNNLSKFQAENLIKIKEILDEKTSTTTLSGIVGPSIVVKNPTTTSTTITNATALNKNHNKSAKLLTENTKTPTNNNSSAHSNENNLTSNNTKKVSNVGVTKKIVGAVAGAVNDDVKNCDHILMGNENLQEAKAKTKTKAFGNRGISDKNSIVVDSVGEVDGKISDNSIITKITTKSSKINKMNKNLNDDLVNNNKSNNNTKITSKPVKTTTTSTTTTTAVTTTTATQPIVTSTANISAAIATAKETKGNSGNVSVLSDSSRNGNSKNRIKITTTTTTKSPTTPITTIITADETKDKLLESPPSSNNSDNKDISLKKNIDSKSEEQKNMALVRSNSTSSMPTGSTKMKTGRSNSLTNGTADKNNPAVARPFLTRGSVAERVMMFEKCPDARHSFLNIKRPDPAEAPPKSLLKV